MILQLHISKKRFESILLLGARRFVGVWCVGGKVLQLPCPTATGPPVRRPLWPLLGLSFAPGEHQLEDGALQATSLFRCSCFSHSQGMWVSFSVSRAGSAYVIFREWRSWGNRINTNTWAQSVTRKLTLNRDSVPQISFPPPHPTVFMPRLEFGDHICGYHHCCFQAGFIRCSLLPTRCLFTCN